MRIAPDVKPPGARAAHYDVAWAPVGPNDQGEAYELPAGYVATVSIHGTGTLMTSEDGKGWCVAVCTAGRPLTGHVAGRHIEAKSSFRFFKPEGTNGRTELRAVAG
jgi:hypothetical protein